MLEVKVEATQGNERCPYCHEALDGEVVRCPECETGYHADCRLELQRCATTGCAGILAQATVAPVETTPAAEEGALPEDAPGASDRRPLRARLLTVLLVLGMVLNVVAGCTLYTPWDDPYDPGFGLVGGLLWSVFACLLLVIPLAQVLDLRDDRPDRQRAAINRGLLFAILAGAGVGGLLGGCAKLTHSANLAALLPGATLALTLFGGLGFLVGSEGARTESGALGQAPRSPRPPRRRRRKRRRRRRRRR